jgi:signal transduction histidine kinase
MKEVFLNLLSNAVEFTPEGGSIEVSTKNNPDGENRKGIRIEIKDTGIGIPQSNMDKIFDPYFTTKHKSNIHNVGLFIAHQNMQDHGGTIEVESKLHEGTLFILTLPANPSLSSTDVPET